MSTVRASDGRVRRAILAVHLRLKTEVEARRAGLKFTGWRGNRPVIRMPTRKSNP